MVKPHLVHVISIISLLLLSSLTYAGDYNKWLCKQNGYSCHKMKRGESWRSLWPDPSDRDIVMRVNRMNTPVYQGMVIAIPDAVQDSDVMDFSPFPKQIDPPQEKMLVFDPLHQAWGAYDTDGTLLRWGPASGGSDWCRDLEAPCHTHAGEFRMYSLGSSSCISHKFPLPDGGAPMPYCMFFNSGQAFHGEPNGLPGYNASHGCIRVYVNDAEWLRYDFVEPPNESNDYRGTKVVVGPYSSKDSSSQNQDEND
jgi:L,D-transpeptidase ErfK/SrfK